jgi:hypothetical protein
MRVGEWTRSVENNGARLIFHPVRLWNERGMSGGKIQVQINGETWTENIGNLGEYCKFAGMNGQRWDTLPLEFSRDYASKNNGELPIGIWSYEPEFGGRKVFGQFVSLDAIIEMVNKIVQDYFKEEGERWSTDLMG